MGRFDGRKTNNWLRVVANLGLLLADAKFRNNVGKEVRSRVDSVTDAISDRYEDAVDRLEAAAEALHGRNPWASRATALLLGIGIGAGVGIMLAPARGENTRRAIRDKTTDLKNRVVETASSAGSRLRSATAMSPTGTEG